jgi:hypothetical protein
VTADKKIYYAFHQLPPGKREMTDEEFREYIKGKLAEGAKLSELVIFRPLVDLKENEEIVYL